MRQAIFTILRTTVVAWGLAAAPTLALATVEESACRDDIDIRVERMTERAALSTKQREAVHAILERNQPRVRQLRGVIDLSNGQLAYLEANGAPDEVRANLLTDTKAKALADLVVLRTSMLGEIEAVLTAEQRRQINLSGEAGRLLAGNTQTSDVPVSDNLLALLHRLNRIDGSPMAPFRLN